MCNSPSLPGTNSTKAPKLVILRTLPSNINPTSGSLTVISTIYLPFAQSSADWDEITTIPSSSTSTLHPLSLIMFRMFRPPGPISSPIFSGSITVCTIFGAKAESSVLGASIASFIRPRICILPVLVFSRT